MRSPARKRRTPRKTGYADGMWEGFGPTVQDAVTGMVFPKKLCVRQRGGWVYARYGYGSRDRPDSY